MKKYILTLLAIAAFQAGLLAQLTVKDPNAEVREAKNFHGISVGNAFDVLLVQGNEEAVAVSASDDKFRDNITVEVKNGILVIGLAKGKWNMNIGNRKLKAYISFKTIDKLDISGACNVRVEGLLRADDLRLELSGASDLRAKLEVAKLSVNLSGASDVKVEGTVTQLNIDASGASKFKGFELATDYCNASASGASDIKITVNKELSVHASGASDIDYKGNGVIRDLKTSGASNVSKA
jgi:hypothetical protein